jgi:hypothetical protein
MRLAIPLESKIQENKRWKLDTVREVLSSGPLKSSALCMTITVLSTSSLHRVWQSARAPAGVARPIKFLVETIYQAIHAVAGRDVDRRCRTACQLFVSVRGHLHGASRTIQARFCHGACIEPLQRRPPLRPALQAACTVEGIADSIGVLSSLCFSWPRNIIFVNRDLPVQRVMSKHVSSVDNCLLRIRAVQLATGILRL